MTRTFRATLAIALAALGLAGVAQAFIPQSERVSRAVAATNVSSGRIQALRLELVMRIGDSDPVATGELITHPTGLARLELRGSKGLVERHLLQGTEHSASRGGRSLDSPREFLPPLFFLQAESAVALNAALTAFGIQADLIGLAACGESDCYVLGDPRRVAPPWEPPGEALEGVEEGEGSEQEKLPQAELSVEKEQGKQLPAVEADRDGAGDSFSLFSLGKQDPRPPATIWIDTETYDVKKLEVNDGVKIWFGPQAAFGEVRIPAWLVIDEPGHHSVRFDFQAATPVNAPASAFSQTWLQSSQGLEPASHAESP